MAQVQEQPIVLGNRGVGAASIDGGAVRGEGGPLHPYLVLPLKLSLQNFPADSMLAVIRVKAVIGADQNVWPRDALCPPVVVDLLDQFPARSFPQGQASHTVELRFPLSAAEIENLETLRHKQSANTVGLFVALDATVAGLKTYNQMNPGEPMPDSPWEFNLGMFSQVFPFWTCRITPLRVEVEQSTWIEKVLPGVGYDRLRLLELTFPPPLPDHSNAARQFDKAKIALDQRRYGDCILECRGLLNMWEQQYGASRNNLVADLVKSERGWPDGDIRRDLLDTLWKEVGDIANAPHHPEGNVNAELFDARDARLILILTAALSEYVERR